jgi:hypothetical protein
MPDGSNDSFASAVLNSSEFDGLLARLAPGELFQDRDAGHDAEV